MKSDFAPGANDRFFPATKSKVQAELHSLEAWVFNPLSWIDFAAPRAS